MTTFFAFLAISVFAGLIVLWKKNRPTQVGGGTDTKINLPLSK